MQYHSNQKIISLIFNFDLAFDKNKKTFAFAKKSLITTSENSFEGISKLP